MPGYLLLCAFSLVVTEWGQLPSHGCAGFSLQWCLLWQSTGLRHAGFSSGYAWRVGSSPTRDQPVCPRIGRLVLHHWPTREVLSLDSLRLFWNWYNWRVTFYSEYGKEKANKFTLSCETKQANIFLTEFLFLQLVYVKIVMVWGIIFFSIQTSLEHCNAESLFWS